MADKFHGFIYDKDSNGVVTVTMDMDGPVNAMNEQYRAGMAETLDRLEKEEGLTGVVLASAKSTFFAGGDLKALSSVAPGGEPEQFEMIESGVKAPLRRLEKLPVPVVAAINGAALGGGLEICFACNHRIAWNSPKVSIGLPEVTLGLLPGGGGVVRSIHMLGLEKALPILLEGKHMKARDAQKAGLVDQLIEVTEDLVSAAKKWIAENPQSAQQPWDQKGHKVPGGDIWSPKVNMVLSSAPAMLFKKTRGLLPAPEKILDVAAQAVTVDIDTALRYESRALAYLITTPQAVNMITTGFFQMNSVKSGASRPKGIEKSQVKKVGILGAGMMGQGIAYSSARSGIEVVLKDISVEAAEKGKAYSAKLLDKQIERGRATEQDKQQLLRLIKATDRYEDLQGCDLIVEAVFENIELKAKVTQEAEPFLAEGGVFGSNTSTLPISQLAEVSKKPENFIGIHFFSPVDKMPLIEIICGEQTSDETLAKAFDYAQQIRKTPIVVNDSLGFFTSRVFSTFLDEGARLLVEGVDPVLIDAMGTQVGMPVGPLTIQDEVSQELTRKAAETHREMGVLGSKGDNSCNIEVCERLISEFNRGGRYHGGGYYEYAEDGSKQVWPKLYELYFNADVAMPNEDIKDRLLFRQVVESLKCLQEGVLRSVADGNVGSLLGIGAPMWTGGFIQFVNTYGLQKFIDRANALAAEYGDRFLPPAIVQETLDKGQSFR
ncbi:3-hydroxyacyl-CoA dehydrogenase NAD-binding domain-containing protein [Microbulbifer sp. CAU 1566]|uniref:3-hydroxyacyl-CoA dehydrogenase NAD-binding domain-containing protein n=1 Tax=Microbulbifer sp. CAU 1566 TaxID=2933269 RepID=UPI0020042ADB|nr:3-hydroxyacyl-CoA dehydrogenase NAD-binding domain-containing protein [Microbulbifer sp. CAU 1566]MCK7597521.1 3-hydroxyacyl-CoA dehydrogenase NAD-binding domain-containing protein [Microbulbifer sp. CAU 1566]